MLAGRGAGEAPCRPARRYEVFQSGNLLSGDRTIIVITQFDATPFPSRHYGVLERTAVGPHRQRQADQARPGLPAGHDPHLVTPSNATRNEPRQSPTRDSRL